MKHVFWVYENTLAGRSGPGMNPWNISDLRAGGIDMILSVASDLFPPADASLNGVVRTCVPLPDCAPPDDYTVRVCRASLPLTLEILRSNIEEARTVLVHCASGCDRTGLVLSYYIAWRERIEAVDAIAKLRTVRPNALSASGWERMALKLLPELLRKDS